jgi:hypothetical protein
VEQQLDAVLRRISFNGISPGEKAHGPRPRPD